MDIFIPKDVRLIIDKIYENGYEAFIVGGCVRDSILNIKPNDYDITTNAKPQDIINIFKEYKMIDIGIKHGTVSIILNKNIYEITTYRIESEYENNRKPKNVEFTSNIEEDLKRRDFTINAMAYNDKIGLVDKFDGLNDIKRKIIKTVGNPDERFEEDALRMIRAIRFSSKLSFNIEKTSLNSIYKNAYLISNISIERVNDEFTKILTSNNPKQIILLFKTGIFENLRIYYNLNGHEYNRLEKRLNLLEDCDNNILDRLIMLEYIIINEILSNINYEERYKYYNEKLKTINIINNLKYSNKITKYCNDILDYMLKDDESVDSITIKNYLNNIGYEKLYKVFYLKLKYSIFFQYKPEIYKLKQCISKLEKIKNNKECYTIKDLDIDGKIVAKLGYTGREIGEKLDFLLHEVIKNPSLNKKEILINLLKL